ncbi:MAG TPA: hypothetical protein VHC40_13850 [Rhizomicrobium sp.]|nr:hypothetical protein [Rhizomicrobium sp.]
MERFVTPMVLSRASWMARMRACFLGRNICALGYGVAMLQTPPLVVDEETGKPLDDGPEDSTGNMKPSPRPAPQAWRQPDPAPQ